jgi:hypothetical protein
MSETREADVESTPWHLWLIGVVALVWSAMGAMDYVMTQTRNEAYMSAFTPEQLSFFYGIPAWAIAVWGGVLGALLLLIRRRHAVWVFLASLIACLANCDGNHNVSKLRPVQWNGDYGRRVCPRICCRDIPVRVGIFSLRPRNA